MSSRLPRAGGLTWIPLPLHLAAPWFELGALPRAIGSDLFRVFQDRPVLGIQLEAKQAGDQVTYPQAESWVLRQLSPNPDERKTIRRAVRAIVKGGLLVPVQGGVRLLFSAESYADHRQAQIAQPSPNGPPTDHEPSENHAPTMDGPSANRDGTVGQPDVNGVGTHGDKLAESQEAAAQREREKQRERETHNARARVREGLPLKPAPEDRERFAEAVELLFRLLHLAAGQGDPAMGGKQVHAFPERLLNTAAASGEDPAALLERTFAQWAAAGFDGSSKVTPYAAFVARFGRYAAPKGKGFMKGSKPDEYANGTDGDEIFGAM